MHLLDITNVFLEVYIFDHMNIDLTILLTESNIHEDSEKFRFLAELISS